MKVSHLLLRIVLVVSVWGCGGNQNYGNDEEKKAAIASMYSSYKEAGFPEVKEVTVEALRESDAQYVVVDVRTEEERAVSMLPGAISSEVYEAAGDQYAGRPVVVYCTIGARSGEYAKSLTKAGVEAYNMPGSVLAWSHAGFPFVDPDGAETRKVHVYGAGWDLLASGYEGVW